jgi:outer membrane protein assembly factor BamD (BamD/ComL family)
MRTNRITIIAFSAILIVSSCNKRVPIATLPPASSPPSPTTLVFDDADRAFTAGSYDEAARGYESYLKLESSGPRRDEALFRMGLAYALRPGADWQRAASAFKQIVEVFPNSPFKPPASLILSLHSDLDQANANAQQRDQRLRQLTNELDRLKRIDSERRKRP